jgi:hypothetical protein
MMKLTKILAGLLMSGAVVSACASSEIGKVDRVYVREARGLYFEKKLLRRTEGKEVWVNVRGATMVSDKSTGEMFKVPADLAIERGDLVATRIGDESLRDLNLVPIPNKVTQLVARHDTLMAMTFGLPTTSPLLNVFMQAKAN